MTEFRPGRFQILPTIIKNLIIINVLVFAAQYTIGNKFPIDDLFALHTWQSPLFKPWQFITHLFMHGSIDHLFFNMFALWMFGATLENMWGPKRFITYYIACGLGAALFHMIVLFIETQTMLNAYNQLMNSSNANYNDALHFVQKFGKGQMAAPEAIVGWRLNEATLGASGAVFGCLAAFGYLFPNTYIYLYFFLPVKAKWFVLFYAAAELYMAVKSSAGDNVAHVAHLGGALVGFLLVYFWNKTNRRRFY
ncbi:Membrane associated serine protease, rhomboid family [Filimonas lacunae]|uniref:Membrane associated serine protease, rhomboid family n=1 Tax=Filimonas lacunae TaxID=477680 RepID=A0A173MQ05_9BACT|nr:rhomboid family intramembrane serine protease [Filimonas lacunae]BAV09577.1 membrane protein of glp regulon GlpG [Filimonas lacunae]SIS75474.1 Membrane associated serine protease, rhomboid family [Filimonas lacunae]